MAQHLPDSSPRTSQDPVRSLAQRTALMAAAGILLVGLTTSLAWLGHAKQRQLDQIGTQLAQRQAATIEQSLGDWQGALAGIATTPELAATLASPDQHALTLLEQSLRLRFPGAALLEALPLGPLGVAGIRGEDATDLSVLEMNMLRRVLAGETVLPEGHKAGGSPVVSLVQLVTTGGGQPVGALVLRMRGSALEAQLSRMDSNLGHSQLEQSNGNDTLALASTGTETADSGSATAALNGDSWTLRFTPSESGQTLAAIPGWPLWLAFALLLLTLPALPLLLSRQLQALYGEDSTKLAQLLDNLRQRPVETPPSFALAIFAPLATAALELARQLRGTAHATPAPATAPQAPTTEWRSPATAALGVADIEEHTLPEVPAQIFRAYDIRGVADRELTEELATLIGQSFGSQCQSQGEETVLVGADGRLSSPRLQEALIRGLLASGVDVVDLGSVPTPLLYFAIHTLGIGSGIMVTGSHNPADHNGFKMVIANETLADEAIQRLRERIERDDLCQGRGQRRQMNVVEDYIQYILGDIAIAQPLKVVLDAGNGIAGSVAPALFEALGCEVIPLYCDVDGHFPHHHPDPSVPRNLQDLINEVRQHGADLGIAFDGDGDRLGVVTRSGEIIAADRLLMLFAKDVVCRNPGADVLFDVKCSRRLNGLISSFGGRPIMWKSGHSYMKQKMHETGALLGGELSGHIFFGERWFGFDDGLYAAARLVEIISISDADLDDLMATFPSSPSTPEIRVDTGEGEQFTLMARLVAQGDFGEGKRNTLDGLRVDFNDGWGLVRPSNTQPALVLRFEADNHDALARIQGLFREQLQNVAPGLELAF